MTNTIITTFCSSHIICYPSSLYSHTIGCTSPLLEGIQPHLGLPTHALPLHTFTPSPAPGSSSSTKPHLLRYVNKEIIKDVDLPGLSVEDIEAVLSENEDWSGEQMDQFLRSAIDLSDIEAKVLSGGYESDSGYSTYDVSPITSAAPTQLTFATSSQLPGLQAAHGHHIEQSLFTCNLSPTATMFPGGPLGHAQPPTSLLHDAIHSPCSSDVGFFSPHSGFSSHATTPSHQDALSFFPSHGGPCPIFAPYSQPQDFNSLNMSTCFPDGSIPNSDSTIPPFSSQIPDILLPDASLAPPTHPPPMSMPDPTTTSASVTKFPKSEPIHSACKVQGPPQVTKPIAMDTSSMPKQNAESAAEIKIESHPNSCVFAAQTQTESSSVSELAGSLKKEQGVEQETQTTSSKQAVPTKSSKSSNTSSQALLSKLLGQNGPPAATIVSITAINNNGTKTKLDLSQLQALVGQTNTNIKGGTKIVAKVATNTTQQQSDSASDSEATSSSSPSSKSKSSTPGPKSVPMKATQRKKGQWPRSMSKANLMAFREHILNKLKKGKESSNGSGSSEGGQKESSSNAASSVELMKCETPSPSSGCGEVEVTYERNRSVESRCHSEPAEMFGGPTSSPSTAPLQSSHSESYLHDSTAASTQQGFGSNDADTKLADFFPQNCNDVFNLFQFNPDALLSTTIDDQMLDGIDLVWTDEDSCKVDSEIAQFLDSEINGTTSETPMELGVQYDILQDHSPITNSPHTSPLVSPANYNSRPSSPQKSMTPTSSYTSVSTTYHSERALITGHVTSGPMGAMQMGMFNFPNMLVATGGANEMSRASVESEMKLHIQQNLLQAHHDPLLTGSSTLLQACGPEAFEF